MGGICLIYLGYECYWSDETYSVHKSVEQTYTPALMGAGGDVHGDDADQMPYTKYSVQMVSGVGNDPTTLAL